MGDRLFRRRLARHLYAVDERRAWLEHTWLRSGQVATLLQVSRRSVAQWASDGRLPYIETPGGHRRFRASDVRLLIDALTVRSPSVASIDPL